MRRRGLVGQSSASSSKLEVPLAEYLSAAMGFPLVRWSEEERLGSEEKLWKDLELVFVLALALVLARGEWEEELLW